MTEFGRPEGVSQPPSYEQIMKNTLRMRTGKDFESNLQAAPPPPKLQKLSEEEAVNLIFDNIINKQQARAAQREQAQAHPPSQPEPQAKDFYAADQAVISAEALHHQAQAQSETDQTAMLPAQTEIDEPFSESQVQSLAQQYAAELDDLLGF